MLLVDYQHIEVSYESMWRMEGWTGGGYVDSVWEFNGASVMVR